MSSTYTYEELMALEYVPVPVPVLRTSKLFPMERIMYMELRSFFWSGSGKAFVHPSLDLLARHLQVRKSRVSALVNALESKGMITIERREGKNHHYYFNRLPADLCKHEQLLNKKNLAYIETSAGDEEHTVSTEGSHHVNGGGSHHVNGGFTPCEPKYIKKEDEVLEVSVTCEQNKAGKEEKTVIGSIGSTSPAPQTKSSGAKDVFKFYVQMVAENFSGVYMPSWTGKNGALLKMLVEGFRGVEETKEYIRYVIQNWGILKGKYKISAEKPTIGILHGFVDSFNAERKGKAAHKYDSASRGNWDGYDHGKGILG